MLTRTLLFLPFSTLVLGACSPPDAGSIAANVTLTEERDRESYALGFDFGESVRPGKEFVEIDAFLAGFLAGLEDESALSPDVHAASMETFVRKVRERIQAEGAAEASAAREAGEAYLAENGARDEVTVTESGLQYEILTEGDGPVPTADNVVRMHYRGTLLDGTEFDTSRGGDPAQFGVGGVIPGFAEALQLMPVGSTWRIVIPSDLAYGEAGAGGVIGPNQVLIFEIELLEIVE
ncbi:MAG: FKBP-type peptidyl-prolyl cis-trans isomerase [Longimicrobiales bacterium]|nr:FKBP-type peptidyl-prolyl cis-trans isomerase [Longimicrobiales bacterium]